jgi:hypothetical protein
VAAEVIRIIVITASAVLAAAEMDHGLEESPLAGVPTPAVAVVVAEEAAPPMAQT